jgi:membrane protein
MERAREHGGEPERPGWGDVLKSLVALQVARAAERVLGRREERQAEAGRKGGEVSAATLERPMAQPTARPAPERPEDKARVTSDEAVEDPNTVPTGAWPITKFVFKEFSKDNGTLMAASVAFYLLLSLVPLVLVAVSIAGYILGSDEHARQQVFAFLSQLVPVGQDRMREFLTGIIDAKGRIGIIGLATLAFTATGGFATLENAINALWNRPNRGFITNKLYAFGMMLVVGGLFALTMLVTTLVDWGARIPGLEWLAASWMAKILSHLVPVLISTLMFAVVFRFYPNGRSGWRTALISGVIIAVLWEAFKIGYTFYARAGDQSIYGIAVGLVMWIYYSCVLLLLGSELTWVLEGCPGREGKEVVHAQRNRAHAQTG